MRGATGRLLLLAADFRRSPQRVLSALAASVTCYYPAPGRREGPGRPDLRVGPVTALALTCWLGGAGQFSSSRQAVRFAGLDITVHSSDGKRTAGRLSRQGPPVLRWAATRAGKAHARSLLTPGHPARRRWSSRRSYRVGMSGTELVAATRFLGVDLAWREGSATGPASESGVAVADASGRILRAGWVRGVAETIDWISSAAGAGPALLFVDAPLIVTNPSGQRPCERQVGQQYGRWKVSANSTNSRSPHLAGVTLCNELRAAGWAYSDGTDWPPVAARTMCECYPFTTLVGTPELGYDEGRPGYKRRPKGMPVAAWRPQRAAACDEIIRRLSSLKAADPPLRLDTHPVTRALCDEPSPFQDDAYKHREDLVDALICAWTAALWHRHGQARCQLLGLPSSLATRPAATIIAPARPGQRQAALSGRSAATRPGTSVLTRGQRFHQRVQTAFLADLLGAGARPEHTITLASTRNGRVDLLVLPQGEERMAVVVEIKSTQWDDLAGHRIRPNLRGHIRQLQDYLDVYIAQLVNGPGPARTTGPDGTPPTWDSVAGVLLYPHRPADRALAELIEGIAGREALMVAWYDEADWADG